MENMRLVLAALSRPVTVVVALVAIALCAMLADRAHAGGYLPAGGRSGHLRGPALRRHGPGPDGRLPDLLLRVSLPLHHRHRSRGEQEHPGRGADEAGVSRGHQHEPGDVGDGGLREPRPLLHAAGHGAAVHHALRRRQRRRRPAGLQQRRRTRRAKCRITRSTACARCSPRCPASPRRRRSAGTSGPSWSRSIPTSCGSISISPEEAIAAVSKATLVMPSGNMWTGKIERIARTNAALGGNLPELLEHAHPARSPAPPSICATSAPSKTAPISSPPTPTSTASARSTFPVTKRADASTLAVIDAVKAAIPDFKKAVPEDVDVQPAIRSVALRDQLASRPGDRRAAGRGADRPDGADLPARLAQRPDRHPEHPVRAAERRDSAVGHRPDHQHHDAGRAGAGGRRAGGRGHGRDREHPHAACCPGVSRARAVVEACSRTAMARLLSMFCILAVFVPSFFMVGVGRQLFVPLSLAVGFSMIASYLLSSSLVPVFSTWLMREAHRGEEREGSSGACARSMTAICDGVLRFRWPLAIVYLVAALGLLYVLLPRMGTETIPGCQRAAAAHPPARAGGHAHRGDRAHRAARAGRDSARGRRGQRRDHQRFRGRDPVQLSGGPDSPVHQRAAGGHHSGGAETRTRRAAKRCASSCATSLARELPGTQVSFEAGDIVTPGDELRIAHARRSRGAGRQSAGRLCLRAEGPGAAGQADLPARPAIRAGDELSRRSTSTSIAIAPASSA